MEWCVHVVAVLLIEAALASVSPLGLPAFALVGLFAGESMITLLSPSSLLVSTTFLSKRSSIGVGGSDDSILQV